jgi:hypothetical protein
VLEPALHRSVLDVPGPVDLVVIAVPAPAVQRALKLGLGLSSFASVGDKADLSGNDPRRSR